MFALQESTALFPISRESNACHVSIRMPADDVRQLARKCEKMWNIRDTQLAKERTVARGNLEDASFAARAEAYHKRAED